jgi:hypothetical protein
LVLFWYFGEVKVTFFIINLRSNLRENYLEIKVDFVITNQSVEIEWSWVELWLVKLIHPIFEMAIYEWVVINVFDWWIIFIYNALCGWCIDEL